MPTRLTEAEEERLLDQLKKGFLYDSSLQALDELYEARSRGKKPSPELLYGLYRDEFVTYMKSKPGVWFATGAQIAEYVKNTPPR